MAMIIKKGGKYLVIEQGKLVGSLKDGDLARDFMSWINKRKLNQCQNQRGI